MKQKSIAENNQYLKDKFMRAKQVERHVASSSAVEGIFVPGFITSQYKSDQLSDSDNTNHTQQ